MAKDNPRNTKPVTPDGLSADEILRRAMSTKPPEHDPKPPKAADQADQDSGGKPRKPKPDG